MRSPMTEYVSLLRRIVSAPSARERVTAPFTSHEISAIEATAMSASRQSSASSTTTYMTMTRPVAICWRKTKRA